MRTRIAIAAIALAASSIVGGVIAPTAEAATKSKFTACSKPTFTAAQKFLPRAAAEGPCYPGWWDFGDDE